MSAKSPSGATLLNAGVDGAGDVVTLYFDQKLDAGNIPSASRFGIGGGSAQLVQGVEVVGNRVILTLDSPLDAHAPVTVSYIDPSAEDDAAVLQNSEGTDVASFEDIAVTNRLGLMEAGEGSFSYAATISLAGAEISAFDASSSRLFVTSSSGLQVIAVNAQLDMQLLGVIALGGNDINSVAVKNGIVAVAVAADDKTLPGSVFFLYADGEVGSPEMVIGSVPTGAQPDMLVFSADGNTVLVANEGEQDSEGNNPEGSVTIIDISGGKEGVSVKTASFASFNDDLAALKASGVRLFAGEAGFEDVSVAQDLEPEYISISPDGTKAFVTLQENNAVAVLDIASGEFTGIVPLGLKSFASLPMDGSDKDGIDLGSGQPVYGQYMPDAIASYCSADGKTYYVIANEGDDRDDFLETAETVRVKDLDLDNSAYPDEALLKSSAELGRLTVSGAPGNNGDTDGDGDIDQLLAYGARSFSILDENGVIVFDSASHIEQFIAAGGQELFDDGRSDNKGPEPEGVTVAQVDGRTLAFIGLERGGGGVMVYDVTDPSSVVFMQYLRHAGDVAPEGLTFVGGDDSPNGQGLLFVTNEASGTVTVFSTNSAPTLENPISEVVAQEDRELNYSILANTFSDADEGDSLTYTATLADGSPLPDWLEFNASHHDTQVMEEYFLKSGAATDSASAATAMATGQKTDDGNIAWESGDPADGSIKTIAETLREDLGYAIGVASTVPFSHATPAGFVSHNVSRNNYWDIAHEILFETEPDVVIGGGQENSNFAKATKNAAKEDTDIDNNGYNDDYDAFKVGTDGTDYLFVERQSGVDGGDALAARAAEVDLSSGEKLFALYGTSGGNFEYYEVADSPGSPSITRSTGDATPTVDEDPTLTEVTNATLSVLNQDEDGFFVMIEQGDIDWSNHANDYENMVGGVYDLDQAVRAAETFVESGSKGISWSNTLVIVTSDHSNSYLRAQEELCQGDLPAQNGSAYPDGEVTYGSGGHTNELVTLQARGAGAELFEGYAEALYAGSNIVDNTNIYDVMMQAAREAGAEHVILFIGDGMNIEHEIAASRYLYGQDFGLAWQDWGALEEGWAGYATTWDVTAYNKYAAAAGEAAYSESTFDPLIGYDPSQGGNTPYPVEMTFSGTPDNGDVGSLEIMVTATDESGVSVSDLFTLKVENTNDAPLLERPTADGSIATGEKLHHVVLANTFSDADEGDSLTYTATLADGSPLPDWLEFNASHHDTQVMEEYFLKSGAATDSASAATAMATGQKTDDGNIAWESGDPADGSIKTIAETLREDLGYAIGVASTVPFSHATPAGFVSHNVSRNNYWDIAHEILFETEPDVVIGGGQENSNFAKATKNAAKEDTDIDNNGYNDDYDAFKVGTDGTDYLFVERQSGVDGGDALAARAAEVDLSSGEKLFALYGTSGGNFEYYEVADSPGSPSITRSTGDATPTVDEDPTLTEVTNATLSVLNQDEDGFFVMIEQGDIDWSNHANDYENMVGGVYDLDQAVRAAETFVESGSKGISWSNTLVIVTSDHSNSYLRAQEELCQGDLPAQNGSAYPDGEVTYGSGGHTNELVTLQARGAGAELFEGYAEALYAGSNIVDNTNIYDVMMQAAREAGAEHVILFIGDGMNIEHEIAASRYLYGQDFGLAWQDWGALEEGWAGYATTWDVTAYNKYAAAAGEAAYSESTFDPLIGYDPSQGGNTPYPVEMTFDGTPSEKDAGVYEIEVSATDEAGASVSDVVVLTVTNRDYSESEGDDTLTGKGTDDVIYGAGGDDLLIGKNGNDTLVGGSGNDTMEGGKGDDTYWVDSEGDVVTEGRFGNDTVISTLDWTLDENVENLVLKGSEDIDGAGNSLDNALAGNEGDNLLEGLLGNDTLEGGAGNDTLFGDKGRDLLIGGFGADLLTGGGGNDIFRYIAEGDSTPGFETMDVICDFTSRHDWLDLSGIDANTSRSGDQAFSRMILGGSEEFTGAGQLRFDSAEGILYGNTDGDADAEFAIQLSGLNTLLSSDLVL